VRLRQIELRICKECNRLYIREYGGIVVNPMECYSDKGLCKRCRIKAIAKKAENILGVIREN
jgi:hypothetical protein